MTSYFTVSLLDHGIILEKSPDGTDECETRKLGAYSWNGNLGRIREILASEGIVWLAYMRPDT